MQREQKAKADTVSDGTSDIWDEDLGGMLSGHLVANKGLMVSNRSDAGVSARNQQREPTREGYLYIRTLRKLAGLCPNCEGGIVGHGETRGSLLRGQWTCQCGEQGRGRELVDVEWFATTVQ